MGVWFRQIEVENNSFWVENRSYVQQDRFVKYNLFKRIELWNQINEQLISYEETLSENIKILDAVLLEKEREWTLIWWWGETPSWLQSSQKSATEEPQDQEQLADQ